MADEEVQGSLDVTPTPKEVVVAEVAPGRDPHMLDAVHYVYNGVHVPSTIYEVFEDGTVRLQATDGNLSASPVAQDASGAEDTFHYPEE